MLTTIEIALNFIISENKYYISSLSLLLNKDFINYQSSHFGQNWLFNISRSRSQNTYGICPQIFLKRYRGLLKDSFIWEDLAIYVQLYLIHNNNIIKNINIIIITNSSNSYNKINGDNNNDDDDDADADDDNKDNYFSINISGKFSQIDNNTKTKSH